LAGVYIYWSIHPFPWREGISDDVALGEIKSIGEREKRGKCERKRRKTKAKFIINLKVY
jgi:hypothetical protein